MNNSFKIEFPASPCNESFARFISAGFIMNLDPTVDELSEVKTAISEAVTNAIIHGYRNTIGKVFMQGEIQDNKVTFTIIDHGHGIGDINKARVALYTGAKDMERSGMGFTIMEAFMDNIIVESDIGIGTKVILIKTIGGQAE